MKNKLFVFFSFLSFCFLICFFDDKLLRNEVVVFQQNYLENKLGVTSDQYLIKDSIIKNVPLNSLKSNFLSFFNVLDGELKLVCENGTDYVGTGCLLKNVSGDEELGSYEISVSGDVSGDGSHTITDVIKILKHVRKKSEFNKSVLIESADVDFDDGISELDVKVLAQYLTENKIIEDFPDKEVPPEDGDDDNTDNDNATITLSTTSVTLDKGSTTQLIATIDSSNVTIIDWKSADPNIAVVDSNGLVTGVNGGSTTITVTASNGSTATVKVNVKVNIATTGVVLNTTSVNLSLGGEAQLSATVSPNDASNKTITWSSNNNNIVVVDKNGKLVGKGVGTATITAKTVDGFSASCTVVVNNLLSVNITSSDDNILLAGDTIHYTIQANNKSATTVDSSKIHLYTQSPIDYQLVEYNNFSITTNGASHDLSIKVPSGISDLGLFRLVVDSGAIKDSHGNTNQKYSKDDYVVSLNLNANAFSDEDDSYKKGKAAISMAVGVDNSFYVKSYDYYINDNLVQTGSTTNALTYTSNITNGNTYKISVRIHLYRDRLIKNSNAYYSSQTGEVSSVEKLSNDVISGTVTKSITVPTAKDDKKLVVDVIDVSEKVGNHGDSILVSSNGKTMLIDTGSSGLDEGGDSLEDGERIVQIIKEKTGKSTCQLDYLLFTHTDVDHTGGSGVVLDKCTVKNVVVSVNHYNGYSGMYSLEDTSDTTFRMYPIRYALKNNINLILLTAGNVINLGGSIINVFFPYNNIEMSNNWLKDSGTGIRKPISSCDYYTDAGSTTKNTCSDYEATVKNNNSIVFNLMLGNRRILLTGDAQFWAEEFMLGLVSNSKGLKIMDPFEVTTASGRKYYSKSVQTTSLVNDIVAAEKITIDQAITKYKLNRFTEKDISAHILKRGHHGYDNSTSIDFINKVNPGRVIVSHFKINGKDNYVTIPYLRPISEARLKAYFDNDSTIDDFTEYIHAPYSGTNQSTFERGMVEMVTYGRKWSTKIIKK